MSLVSLSCHYSYEVPYCFRNSACGNMITAAEGLYVYVYSQLNVQFLKSPKVIKTQAKEIKLKALLNSQLSE